MHKIASTDKVNEINFHVPLIKRAPEVVSFMVLEKCLKLWWKFSFASHEKKRRNQRGIHNRWRYNSGLLRLCRLWITLEIEISTKHKTKST